MRLEQVTGKSKKTGKQWTGYRVLIGKYKTPIFFPSEVELWYIQKHFEHMAGTDESNTELPDEENK